METKQEHYESMMQAIARYAPSADLEVIQRAYAYADEKHKNQLRKSGEPYIIHPLAVAEIVADLELDVDSVIAAGPFQYNTSTLRFYKNGREILLSSKENAMMKLFIDNVNRIFSKDMLYDLIWGEAIIDENAIMVYVNRLRQKIEEDPSNPRYIQTVRGLGYRFVV